MALEPTPRAISQLLLRLHERAHELGYRAFQNFSLKEIATLIPFDGGLLAMGTIQNGVPHGHDALLDRRPPEFIQSWEQIKTEDRVVMAAMREPDRTHAFDVEGGFLDGCDAALAHCREWKVAHILCTASIDAATGLYRVMAMHREDPGRPFSETERAAKELIVPHLFAAARQARIGQLRESSRGYAGHGRAAAIVGDSGLVLEAEPNFVEILRAELPGFQGPWLPADLWRELRSDVERERSLQRVIVRTSPVQGVWLLQTRRRVAADQLTAREREVAEAFSLGENYREIGARLSLSPNTVRRHLANIYEKLGISSKAELDRMVSTD
jgi:DNA-binding CsgD family transcriptional regulator